MNTSTQALGLNGDAPATPTCGLMAQLPGEALNEVAAFFQALAEPSRLRLLQLLRDGERKVGDLAAACGYSAANVSRHLTLLTHQGLVAREARGTAVYYRIADPAVFGLCELVCGSIGRRWSHEAARQQALRLALPAEQGGDAAVGPAPGLLP